MRRGERLGRALFRAALRTFPADFRRRHAPEMREAFETELADRRRSGWLRGAAFALRASWDAARQGWTERTRRGPLPGHGGRTPGDGRRGGMLDGIGTDVRLGLRALARSPGFTAAAVVVLALGIGANATVFSALKTAILSPLPYPDAERLVMVDLTTREQPDADTRTMPWSYPKFQALLDAPDRLVEQVAGYGHRNVTVTEPGEPELVNVELVSPGYFALLGADPVVGRGFGPDEGNASDPRLSAVVSYGFWRERLGGASDPTGRQVVLRGRRYDVVGVAPVGFEGLSGGIDVWVPMATAGELFNRFMIQGAQAHWMHVVGRLRPGATLAAAREQMEALGESVAEQYPMTGSSRVLGADARALSDVYVNDAARAAVVLLAVAAGLVLLVACANLSGLLLARARRRARDGAVRVAMGASRWRLLRASLVESLVLALIGGGAGLAVAWKGTRALAAAWPRQFLRSAASELRVTDPGALGLDGGVLAFALLVTALTAVLFGTLPGLRASRADVGARLRNGAGATRRERRVLGMDVRAALVAAQVALALVLLVGAGMVGGSMRRLLAVDEGFDTYDLLTFGYALPPADARADDASTMEGRLIERIASLPGVLGVSCGVPPLAGHWSITSVEEVEGAPPFAEGERPSIGVNLVCDHHFETLGIPILRGRTLDERDGTDEHPTIVLSRTAAETLFPEVDPIGRHVQIGISADGKDDRAEVVGVVGDVLYDRPDREVIPESYLSHREFAEGGGFVLVRTAGDPLSFVPAIRREVHAFDATVAIHAIASMDDLVARSTGDRRIVLALLALFAGMTLLLAATGTWGIVAYAVADRRREVGLRMALGAEGQEVRRLVVRQSVVAALWGVALGVLGAWLSARLLASFLWHTSRGDPAAYAAGTVLLLSVVLVASWLPARRASRVDPAESLRAE